MSQKETGGPAFPNTGNSSWSMQPCEGMTLRDYFAAKAMQALVKNDYFDTTARLSYQIADAMLKARSA